MKRIDYAANGRLNIVLSYLVSMDSGLISSQLYPPNLKSLKFSQNWKVTATDSERRSDFIWIKERKKNTLAFPHLWSKGHDHLHRKCLEDFFRIVIS